MPIIGGTKWELNECGCLEYTREDCFNGVVFWRDLSREETRELFEYLAANILPLKEEN